MSLPSTVLMQLAVAAVLLAALAAALLVPPAPVCTRRMLRASLVCGMPGCIAGALGTLTGTPAGLALGLAGGRAAAASLWALRAPVAAVGAPDDPEAGRSDDDDGGRGGGGSGPPGGGDPDGGGLLDPLDEEIDWEAFERRAYAAFEAHRADRGPRPLSAAPRGSGAPWCRPRSSGPAPRRAAARRPRPSTRACGGGGT